MRHAVLWSGMTVLLLLKIVIMIIIIITTPAFEIVCHKYKANSEALEMHIFMQSLILFVVVSHMRGISSSIKEDYKLCLLIATFRTSNGLVMRVSVVCLVMCMSVDCLVICMSVDSLVMCTFY